MKKTNVKYPIKNIFTYPSGKEVVVMAKTKTKQREIEDDMEKIRKETNVDIQHQKVAP